MIIKIKNEIKSKIKKERDDFYFEFLIRVFANKNIAVSRELKMSYLDSVCRKDVKKFFEIKDWLESENIRRLSEKRKIKVGFITYTVSMWSCDDLYKMLEKSEKFDPFVMVADFADGTPESRRVSHEEAVRFFKDRGYKLVNIRNDRDAKNALMDCDILFYLTPYRFEQKAVNILNIPMRILAVHIPYSFMVAEREEKYNLPMYRLVWRFFTDTLFYKDLMKKHSTTGDRNVEFCGFMRMDEFLDNKETPGDIWKVPEGAKGVKKIIYAPHHSVCDKKAGFSTFDQNYKFMYELAKKYQNETSWVIKPHPLMRSRIVQNGFFANAKEYDDYLKDWAELPNAKVMDDGAYFGIFKDSDAMILDSASFLAEYQYTGKPLLFLTRDTQRFNIFGEKLRKILYLAKGDDFEVIEGFLRKVIFGGEDTMKEQRARFFKKYLDYYDYNGKKTASQYVYDFLCRTFAGGEK